MREEKHKRLLPASGLLLAVALQTFAASAAGYPEPKLGDWIARDFKFHSGEIMPELKLHYETIGDPSGVPVVVLHGRSIVLWPKDWASITCASS
jgi:homoserine O-acetyltransferase